MKLKIITLCIVFLCSSIFANDNHSGFEVTAGVGKYFYDNSNLDNATMTVLGFGYKLDENWQVEIIRGNPDTTLSPGNGNIDVDWSALRGLYHFNHSERFSHYISAGMDSMDVFSGRYQGVLGLGLKMNLQGNLFWRLEANYHTKESETSLLAMLGYKFGGSSYTPPRKKDSDGDGVYDNVDACPNSPSGSIVDDTGCVVKVDIDSDNDGVVDRLDKCPNTPRKALVDSDGCQKELLKEVSVNLQINFDTNKDVVKSEFLSEIEAVAEFMTQYSGTSVVIEGHTDSQGTDTYNQGLSSRRAGAVAKILIEKYDIAASRVTVRGHGEELPIADNNTAEGRLANRRVVAVIKQQVKEKQWQ